MQFRFFKFTGLRKCPHCGVAFSVNWKEEFLGQDANATWTLRHANCPDCGQKIVLLTEREGGRNAELLSQIGAGRSAIDGDPEEKTYLAHPRSTYRPPPPKEVPEQYVEDYNEACSVLDLSEKASAALSRRCLQSILQEEHHVKSKNLHDQIQEVLDNTTYPSFVAERLHHVRVIGNFATHPIKSTNSGEVIDVEPGEAEWLLETLEAVFDADFVQKDKLNRQKEAINKKLADAGKNPLPER